MAAKAENRGTPFRRYSSTRMPDTRLDALRQMVSENPADRFSRYALAMEYRNGGQLEAAVVEFEALVGANPDYAAAYFQCGRTLESLRRTQEAGEMYRRGIAAAQRTGDSHTQSELQAALDLLG